MNVLEDLVHLTHGRRYVYPDQVDRLAEDIMVKDIIYDLDHIV